jgi:3-hydroxyacyl-[acyl-carrier-protein] dehydratase
MWIDRIVELEPGRRLVAVKNVSLAEDHLHEHFPGGPGREPLPVMPASLIIEGMAQAAGILVGHAGGFREKVILAKVREAVLEREVVPGQTLRYTATVEQMDGQGASTGGLVEVWDWKGEGTEARGHGGTEWEVIGRVDLMFSHLDRNMAGEAFPEHNFVFGEGFRTLLRMSGVPGSGSR